MKIFFDFSASVILIILLSMPMILIAIAIRLSSKGPAIYWSLRVGKDNKSFKMPKFRTMKIDTPEVATHLLEEANIHLSPIGSILRSTSLDELPQLFSVLKGDMSIVGYRPALFNQLDLIELRTNTGVNKFKPGITGWAQINGRDELSIIDKVDLEVEYLGKKSFLFDLKIIWLTLLRVIKRKDISH